MTPSDVADGFKALCEISGASLEPLKSGFRRAIEELGFRYFAFWSRVDPLNPPPHAIILHNYPTQWVRHFSASKYYAIDPVLARAEHSVYPFYWDDVFDGDQISSRQRIVLSEAARFGLAHGYTVPINCPWTPLPLSASCSVIPSSAAIPRDHYLAAQLITHYLHFSISARYASPLSVPRAGLTDRERECLMLAAQGLNDREIASELGLAVTTAHSHIENSMVRLGANRRIQAIIRAIMSGEISLLDLVARSDANDRSQRSSKRQSTKSKSAERLSTYAISS